ncbi:alkaline phosphatase family protein [Nocardioides guangzhouensis]|uniref:Alkaline phosphatase family protein n=1 Tax=Nocardioides guangzhouensis TaxID=2497878 RepID=A0A4Q4ZGC9_9ACTN|nr:alkaline phosphatase family protein [Nocardioides guangzhouensis]RYP86878.1 alkaline phosphatase family protein [Nocardioides guangzhouensis]
MTRLRRRAFLEVLGAGGATLAFSSAVGAATAAPRKRSYVLVLDGCRPDEIDSGLMPTVQGLRDGGTHYPRASSLPVMETIPNHVMMMTGVRPDRNGVPANAIFDRGLGAVRDLDRASDIRATTVIEQLNRSGRTTGTVLSKEYLYGVFGARATHRWEPEPVVPVSGHAPDIVTVDAAITMVEQFDPHLVFVNLGDIDRLGHSDVTGTTGEAARRTALASADLQVKRFVDLLRSTGRWESSLLVVLADHSMDWSLPHRLISLQPLLDADPLLAGRVRIAQNGGADLLYWTGPDGQRQAAVDRMRTIAAGHPGVLAAHDRVAERAWLRLGARAGDVLVWCRAGWRFSDPDQTSNPIPGNHGHPATYPIPFFLAGGHPVVRRGVTEGAHARTVDVAPTVAAYFGLPAPAGGWDGTSRL